MVAETPDIHADVLISCGDLPDEVILQAAARVQCSCILAVKGNNDSATPFPAPIIDLHLRTIAVKGIGFGGFNGCWKYEPNGHFLYEDSEAARMLSSFPRVDVFVAHNSPQLIHDKHDAVHKGFASFNAYIDRMHPRLFFHGHQHINAETLVGTTRVVGTIGHRYLTIEE